ncbi:pre-mRNA-splicing factor cwc22-like, partial [Brachypodium distachyon]
WDALRRSITGLVNKATAANIRHVLPELLAENLVCGRGLLCRALIKSQAACPAFTDVFAALAAVVNSKLPSVGRLLLVRLAIRIRHSLHSNDKPQLVAAARFVAHLVNQGVAHELLALEILETLLARPTDGSVEVAVGVVRECGATLRDACPRLLDAVFDALMSILRDGNMVDRRRTEFMIEGLLAVRKAQFRAHPSVRPELDLVETEDQLTHQVEISSRGLDPESHLDVFSFSATFLQDEAAYEDLKRSMLGLGGDLSSSEDEDDAQVCSSDERDMEEEVMIKDETATDLVGLQRTIYLTIMSAVGFEEAGHKLMSVVRPGQESELCAMLIECCRQERTYTRYYGLLAQRLCGVHHRAYQAGFEACFSRLYANTHRMGTDELRGSARLYAHLLATDAVSWRRVLAGCVRLTEEDTTSSSHIFIKLLFQELSEQLGVPLLSRRLNDQDPAVRDALFPADSVRNTRFAVNFFTAIGLAGVTQSARDCLVNN